jgi:hypothetical protein
MMRKRNVYILTFAVLPIFVLLAFQNCGQTSEMTQGSIDREVRVVDEWNKVEIQFADNSLQVHDEAESTGVTGLCSRSHNGAQLRWALWGDEPAGTPLLQGGGVCKSGQFFLQIERLDQVVCGIRHRLVVEGDWGGKAAADFEKRCQPLASEYVAAPESSPAGTDCSIEYVPGGDSGSSCAQVCYRGGIVVFNVSIDPLRCSGLVQKLASP